ncbi:hypothetical protein BLOT_011194, partial [Blomia tropicalis]
MESGLHWQKTYHQSHARVIFFPPIQAIEFTEMSSQTIVNWYKLFKKICCYKIRDTMGPIGGENFHVQIDETFIHHRKYDRGREIGLKSKSDTMKLFGGICIETGEIFLLIVPDCSQKTIWPIMKHFIKPGSILYTDGAAIYQDVCSQKGIDYGFGFHSHEWVNHSTGQFMTTNNIEVVWRWIKNAVSGQGFQENVELDIYSYLYRKMYLRFDRNTKGVNGLRFKKFLTDISYYYPTEPFITPPVRNSCFYEFGLWSEVVTDRAKREFLVE